MAFSLFGGHFQHQAAPIVDKGKAMWIYYHTFMRLLPPFFQPIFVLSINCNGKLI
jgi:hypothetical protein